jgi:hypothetical protein
MARTIELGTITLDRRETAGVTQEQEQKIINILIDSSLFLEMSLEDRKRLIQYLKTLYY